jgi:(1->4)-alpha-D-glucan 1-alpha-D-glucosylmutase
MLGHEFCRSGQPPSGRLRAADETGVAVALGFVLDHPERGAIKMWVVQRVLNYRRAHAELFAEGDYIPVVVKRPILAYLRRHVNRWVLVLIPLISAEELPASGFSVKMPDGAPPTRVDRFTGHVHHLSNGMLEWPGWDGFPVAMLVGE